MKKMNWLILYVITVVWVPSYFYFITSNGFTQYQIRIVFRDLLLAFSK